MFWRFGGYANISTLDSILDKPDVTLQDLLDESDLIQELKQRNSKLIEYLRDEKILRRLLEYVIAPETPRPPDAGEESEEEQRIKEKSLSPFRRSKENREKTKRQEEREDWDKADKARQKNAYIASEILASETWSIIESLMENQHHLRTFWEFLHREAPLEATAAGYFTKVNETLLDKKTEETLRFVKAQPNVVNAMLRHVDCPMIMDLLLKIISMEKSEGGMGIVDWLQSEDLIPSLLQYLAKDYPAATQTSAGDFIKAIITISANASGDTQSCIGPNNLTRQLVSEGCIQSLVSNMLRGGNPLTVGVGTIIEVIRKNNSDYDMDNGAPDSIPSSNDPIYLGSLLRNFAKHVPRFMELILSPTHTVPDGEGTTTRKRENLSVAFGSKIEPLGFDRFKTCELMAELLHCSNMGLLNEKGSEAYVRQRDAERDQRKAEGSLTLSRPPTSTATDHSENITDINGLSVDARPGPFDEGRKLEVMNNAEDDGFEDVGTSAELEDDLKEDFDEKETFELESKPAQIESLIKQVKPRLDLDEEFFDEPLTSPKLEASDRTRVNSFGDSDTVNVPAPLAASPTSALGSQVTDAAIAQDAHMDSDDSDIPTEIPNGGPAAPPPLSVHPPTEAPPLPARTRPEKPTSPEVAESPTLFSHPDDKPAPLFAKRFDTDYHEDTTDQPGEESLGAGDSQVSIDTTLAEEGDSARSVIFGNNDPQFEPQIERDDDGEPLVGDLLKMMFVEHRVVPTILDFFFRFPWNNFLHNVVYDVVQQVFNGPMDKGYNRSLAIDLFQNGRITERIVEGQQRSDGAQAKNNMRLGYMGHLTLIAEEVVKFSDRHPNEMLSQAVMDKVTSRQWTDYVENTLSETRERDNAILGGIPPNMSVGPRQAVLNAVNAASFGGGATNALANAGLNGTGGLDSMDLASNGGSGTSSAFGLSSGSLLSGFGSSSDEEDEEMEEVEGDEAGIAGSDQLPTTSSPLSAAFNPATTATTATNLPPTDPPPAPPPLNLPPSRARRQFAARLALHSQQAQQAQAQAHADALAAVGTIHDGARDPTPVQEHPQDLGSPPPPPPISVTHHGDNDDNGSSDDNDDDEEDDDDGIVTMQHIPKQKATAGRRAAYKTDSIKGEGEEDDGDYEDAESEEMRFGGEGLEGFVHSPRRVEEG